MLHVQIALLDSIPQHLVQHQTYAKHVLQTLIQYRRVINKPSAYATVAMLDLMVDLASYVHRANIGFPTVSYEPVIAQTQKQKTDFVHELFRCLDKVICLSHSVLSAYSHKHYAALVEQKMRLHATRR